MRVVNREADFCGREPPQSDLKPYRSHHLAATVLFHARMPGRFDLSETLEHCSSRLGMQALSVCFKTRVLGFRRVAEQVDAGQGCRKW